MAGSGLEGKTLGPYRVISQIGIGGMAKVYKGFQPAMERIVALKVLPEQYAQDPQFVERFCREARTIAQLEHRNILPVYDFGEQDGVTYLVMRYLEGGTLKERLDQRRFSLAETVEVMVQVCAALDYAHRNGVIHRDVKPSNVLIDREGAVYLSDFGIAKVLESSSHLTQTGTMLGTPAYMSPEQCRGEKVDHRSDIYSLGIVLYELAAGRVPFRADTPMAVLFAHLHEPLPMPRSINPAIPEALQNVILKALAKIPGDRYQTAAQMGAALRRAVPPEEHERPAPRPAEATLLAAQGPVQSPQAEETPLVTEWIEDAPARPEMEEASAEQAVEEAPAALEHDEGLVEQAVEETPHGPLEIAEPPAMPELEAVPELEAGSELETGSFEKPAEELPRAAFPEPAVPAPPMVEAELAEAAGAPLLPAVGEPPEETRVAPSGLGEAAAEPERALPAGEMAAEAVEAAPKETGRTKPGKRVLLWGLGLGLALLLGVAGLAGGLNLLFPRQTPEGTPGSPEANLPPPTLALTQAPQPSPSSRPTATRRLAPTATSRPAAPPLLEPRLIDNFDDPAFQGKMNMDLWSPAGTEGCEVFQQEGVLWTGNQPRPALLDCSVGLKVPAMSGSETQSMQAGFMVDPDIVGAGHRTALAWEVELPASENVNQGLWLVKCGILKERDIAATMWIQDMRVGGESTTENVYESFFPIPPVNWHQVRLQVEPETMTFSCWLNDFLVGMYTPVSELKLLKEAPFHPYLLVARGERGRMRVAIDELVFIPHARLPKAGEAAMLKEGCLPPPEGMIGWWTGDGTLENQVWPNRGQGQGAWGYAKGKVGQAFAFQNFPNRPGIISFPTYPAIKMMQAVTVEGWVRLDAGPGKRIERFLTIEPETLVIRHEGNLAPGRLHFYMKINGELRHLYSQRLLKAGVFHHVAGTYDGETMKLYLDGMLMNSHSIKGTLAETGDGLTFSGGETLDGLLDEFTLYNRALGGDEIEAIYQAGAAGKCRP